MRVRVRVRVRRCCSSYATFTLISTLYANPNPNPNPNPSPNPIRNPIPHPHPMQELRDSERRNRTVEETRRQSIRALHRQGSSKEWLGVKKTPAASPSASPSTSPPLSLAESSSCVRLTIDTNSDRVTVPFAECSQCSGGSSVGGGSGRISGPSESCSAGGSSASRSSLTSKPSLRGSSSGPTADSSTRRSKASSADAPGARAGAGEGEVPPPPQESPPAAAEPGLEPGLDMSVSYTKHGASASV